MTLPAKKIYDKITTKAAHLVEVGQAIEAEFGIPIANKRITVTPIALIAGASGDADYVKYALTLERAAEAVGVDLIGGFSALVQKGMTPADETLINSIPAAFKPPPGFVRALTLVQLVRGLISMPSRKWVKSWLNSKAVIPS